MGVSVGDRFLVGSTVFPVEKVYKNGNVVLRGLKAQWNVSSDGTRIVPAKWDRRAMTWIGTKIEPATT